MTSPDELVRDGLLRIADQAAPVSGGGLATRVIAAAERRHRRTLATTVTAVVAVLLLGAVTATTVTGRRDGDPAGRLPFRRAVASGPVVIGWYHMRGMKDDTDWVLNPATGRYRLLRGETIMDISPDGRTALAYPDDDRYASHVDLVDLTSGAVTAVAVGHPVINARWTPDGSRFVATVTDTVAPEPKRAGFVVVDAGSWQQRYVALPGPSGTPQELRWTSDSNGLWSWADWHDDQDILTVTRYDLDGRPQGAITVRSTPAGVPGSVGAGPLISPHDRFLVTGAGEAPYTAYHAPDGKKIGLVGTGYETYLLGWYDDTHLVAVRSDADRNRTRVVALGLDGRVTKVLVPWQPDSLKAQFHVYRQG